MVPMNDISLGEFDLYNPTEEHRLLRDTVRAFTRAEVEPQALEHDRDERFNLALFRKLGEGRRSATDVSIPQLVGYELRSRSGKAARKLFEGLTDQLEKSSEWCIEGGGEWLLAYRSNRLVPTGEISHFLVEVGELLTTFRRASEHTRQTTPH